MMQEIYNHRFVLEQKRKSIILTFILLIKVIYLIFHQLAAIHNLKCLKFTHIGFIWDQTITNLDL